MGMVTKVLDALVLGLVVVEVLAVPLFDAQVILPQYLFPQFLISFKEWFTLQLGHYLLLEMPNWYSSFGCLQLLFNWPLSIVSLYAFLDGNSVFNKACLLFATSLFTCTVAILGELLGSGRASDKLLSFYFIFMIWSALAIVRGLFPVRDHSSGGSGTTSNGRRLVSKQKKRP